MNVVNHIDILFDVLCIFLLDISLAVPIANGVSFVSTSIIGTLIGEEKPKLSKSMGQMYTFKLNCVNKLKMYFYESFHIVCTQTT